MLLLKKNPELSDFQEYVRQMVRERCFDIGNVPQKFMLLMEECGEMAKAARKAAQIHSDKHSEQFNLAHEAADVFIYLLDICNYFHIDLEKAFRDKEEINKARKWE